MPHCDPEVLSLVALGEPAGSDDLAHLQTCPECRADVDRLREVVDTLRTDVPFPGHGLPAVVPVAPPPAVWAGIAAATGVRVVPRPEQLPAEDRPTAPVRPPAARRRPARRGPASRLTLLAVAASTLLLGAAGGSLITWQLTRPEPPPQALVLHRADLGALPAAPQASGTAEIIETPDGPHLKVDVREVKPLEGDFYEVWLIDRSVQRMVPVGILRGTNGDFTIPPGLDLSDYAVVDISVETPGDPRHSGRSVLRGVIQT